jgi:hypothetical protein
MRSITLPIAPPMISDSASGRNFSPRGSRHNQTTSATLTTIPSVMKNPRCQPEALASRLNAAPVLCSSVKFSTDGSTTTLSYNSRNRVTRNLVAWSNTTTNSDSHSQAAGCVRWKRSAVSVLIPIDSPVRPPVAAGLAAGSGREGLLMGFRG